MERFRDPVWQVFAQRGVLRIERMFYVAEELYNIFFLRAIVDRNFESRHLIPLTPY